MANEITYTVRPDRELTDAEIHGLKWILARELHHLGITSEIDMEEVRS